MLNMEVVWSNNALLSAQAAADYARDEFGDFQVRKLREKGYCPEIAGMETDMEIRDGEIMRVSTLQI